MKIARCLDETMEEARETTTPPPRGEDDTPAVDTPRRSRRLAEEIEKARLEQMGRRHLGPINEHRLSDEEEEEEEDAHTAYTEEEALAILDDDTSHKTSQEGLGHVGFLNELAANKEKEKERELVEKMKKQATISQVTYENDDVFIGGPPPTGATSAGPGLVPTPPPETPLHPPPPHTPR